VEFLFGAWLFRQPLLCEPDFLDTCVYSHLTSPGEVDTCQAANRMLCARDVWLRPHVPRHAKTWSYFPCGKLDYCRPEHLALRRRCERARRIPTQVVWSCARCAHCSSPIAANKSSGVCFASIRNQATSKRATLIPSSPPSCELCTTFGCGDVIVHFSNQVLHKEGATFGCNLESACARWERRLANPLIGPSIPFGSPFGFPRVGIQYRRWR
jgi:hypothetical protein